MTSDTFQLSEGCLWVEDVISLIPPDCDDALWPIYNAVRDCQISSALVLPNFGQFSVPLDRPTVVLLVDDPVALGPTAFDAGSVVRLLGEISAAVVISDSAQREAGYSSAVQPAVVLGHNVLVIYTGLKFESAWQLLINRVRPGLPMLVYSPEPLPGVH